MNRILKRKYHNKKYIIIKNANKKENKITKKYQKSKIVFIRNK